MPNQIRSICKRSKSSELIQPKNSSGLQKPNGKEFENSKSVNRKFFICTKFGEIDTPSEQLEINQSANKSIPNKPIDFLNLLCRSVFL